MNNTISLNLGQIIQTSRLQLIPQLSQHAEEMFRVLKHPSLYEFTGGKPPTSEESLTIRFKQLESRTSPDGYDYWLNWVIKDEKSDLIGYVQATVSSHEATIGSKWQKRGYAVEAASALIHWLKKNKVPLIRAYIHPNHRASQAVAKKVGLINKEQFVDDEALWEFIELPQPFEPA